MLRANFPAAKATRQNPSAEEQKELVVLLYNRELIPSDLLNKYTKKDRSSRGRFRH
jgi:hypothetical protein